VIESVSQSSGDLLAPIFSIVLLIHGIRSKRRKKKLNNRELCMAMHVFFNTVLVHSSNKLYLAKISHSSNNLDLSKMPAFDFFQI
jgi:hypothetical protein